MHLQGHLRVGAAELAHHGRQRVTGLGMGGGNGQQASSFVPVFIGHQLDAVHLAQHLAGPLQNDLANGRDIGELLALAGKDLDAEFVFQQANLLADARLGGEQAFSRLGNVQAVLGHFPNVAQLLELHGAAF